MRRSLLIIVSTMIAIMTIATAATAADLAFPPPNQLTFPKPGDPVRPPPKPAADAIVQKNQKTCAQWTDGCVNCTRGATSEEGPVCSNIGFACQPSEIRCLMPETSPDK